MAAKKGFFQKADQKKQYSENVLHNVEDAYRSPKRGRSQNPISSNTMSGEEPDAIEDSPLTATQEESGTARFKKPVGYAFAGPQAKKQKQAVMEAMQALEVDVQETKGNYEPIQEFEIENARNLGMKSLLFERSEQNAMQYELEFDATVSKEFQQSEQQSQFAPQIEQPLDYRRDAKKTQMLDIPTGGIKRSNRGTIEAVFQPDGKVVEAQYNRCGILIEVSVAGALKFTRAADTGQWMLSYTDGSPPVNCVSNVAFDRNGNLCFCTDDGHTTVICADGSVIERV